jgi:hypothetical protein
MHAAEIEEGGAEILFHAIFLFSFLFDGSDQRTAIDDGNVERFHDAKIDGKRGVERGEWGVGSGER